MLTIISGGRSGNEAGLVRNVSGGKQQTAQSARLMLSCCCEHTGTRIVFGNDSDFCVASYRSMGTRLTSM